jgi:hypothetical protein
MRLRPPSGQTALSGWRSIAQHAFAIFSMKTHIRETFVNNFA